MKTRPDAVRRTKFAAKVKKVGDGSIDFVLSTGNPDRSGDVLEPDGWHLDHFRNNPVLLYAHGQDPVVGTLPVGRIEPIKPTKEGLLCRAEFVPEDKWPLAGTVAWMANNGYLNAFSVGWRPLKIKQGTEVERKARGVGSYGVWSEEHELLEASIVPVPDNAEALRAACAAGRRTLAPIYKGDGADRGWMTKGLNRRAVEAWVKEKTMKIKAGAEPGAPAEDAGTATEEMDATGHCDAALAILGDEAGVTPESLKEAIGHLTAMREMMPGEDEEPEEEEPEADDENEPAEDEDEDEDDEEDEDEAPPPAKAYAAIEARLAALEKKQKSGDSSDEIEDEVEAALAGDLELPGLAALEGALGLDDTETEES